MLQHLGINSLLEIILSIFNLSWSQGQVPQIWKEAIIMPILKKGKNRSMVSSYRPIGLTSGCCKLMERIINNVQMDQYLYNRRARVQVDWRCGRKVLLKQGVPQGGVLPPTLFILYMNDLVPELPKGVHTTLYADDLVLRCSEEYANTAKNRIQNALDRIVTWAEQWCVTINREKTTGTLFTLSSKA